MYTLTCRTLIFLLRRVSAHIRTSSCVSHTRMAQVPEKVHCTCVIFVLCLAFSLLRIHPSLLFLHGHFETNPDYDFTDSDIREILSYFPVLKAQDTCNSAHASRSLATWPSQMQTHVASLTSSKITSVDNDTIRINDPSHKFSDFSKNDEREH